MSYTLRNSSKYLGKKGDTHWWTWTAFIEASNGDTLNDVKYVEYQLHSSFTNPIKKSRKSSDGFSITLKGWGTFLLRARVVYKDPEKPALSLTHTLLFEDGDNEYENV